MGRWFTQRELHQRAPIRDEYGAVVEPKPTPPRVIVVDGREWWSIWDGKEGVLDAIDRHRHGVVLTA